MDTRKYVQSKFLKARDIDGPTPVTIQSAELVRNKNTGEDQISVTFEEFGKPLPLNKKNHKAIAKVTGSWDTDEWTGAMLEIDTEAQPMADDGYSPCLRALAQGHKPAASKGDSDLNDKIPF